MSGPIAKDGFGYAAYVGGKEAVDGIADPFKLSANETRSGQPESAGRAKIWATRRFIPMAARALCARNWPRSMGWMRRALSAAMARMIF